MISFIIKSIIIYLIVGLLVLLLCYDALLELYIKRKKHIKYENMHTIINPPVKFYKLGQHLTEKDKYLYKDYFDYYD